MALIPELSNIEHERVRLVSSRYTFTVLSNLSVFLLYLHGPESVAKYRAIAFAALGAGLFVDFIFWFFTREPPKKDRKNRSRRRHLQNGVNAGDDDSGSDLTESLLLPRAGSRRSSSPSSSPVPPTWTWSSWFGVRDFYFVGLTYMTTRIVVNLSQVYL